MPYIHAFDHRMAHLSAIFGMTSPSDMIHFSSLEFPMHLPVGIWVPPVFKPSQTFLFGSLDFLADRLGVLHLREEALVPAPIGGGAPSVGSGPPGDLNDETPALRSEPTLGSNPTVSKVHIVLYSLFNIFRRLPGVTPLSPPQPPCNRFPYGLASPTDAYTRGSKRC